MLHLQRRFCSHPYWCNLCPSSVICHHWHLQIMLDVRCQWWQMTEISRINMGAYKASLQMYQSVREMKLIGPLCEKWEPIRSACIFSFVYFLDFLYEMKTRRNPPKSGARILILFLFCSYDIDTTFPKLYLILVNFSIFRDTLLLIYICNTTITSC